MKALSKLPLRLATGLVASLPDLAGPDSAVLDVRTLCRRQKDLNLATPYRQSAGTLGLLTNIAPVSATGSGEPAGGAKAEGFAKKHGPSHPRQRHKRHLGIDADTLEIKAIEATASRVGAAPMPPELSGQIPGDQLIGKVSADGACDKRGCHAAIAARQDARQWLESTPGTPARKKMVRATRRLGRTIRRWSGYHRQSLAETRMRCFRLPGEWVMARDFDRPIAEPQIRAFAGSPQPVAFPRSRDEPLHGFWNAAKSTRGMGLFKGSGTSATG